MFWIRARAPRQVVAAVARSVRAFQLRSSRAAAAIMI